MQAQTISAQLNQVNQVSMPVVSNAKSPGLLSPGPQTSQAVSSMAGTINRATVLQAKAGTQQPQQQPQQPIQVISSCTVSQATATPLYSQKQLIQHRPGAGAGQPVVIGQIGQCQCLPVLVSVLCTSR